MRGVGSAGCDGKKTSQGKVSLFVSLLAADSVPIRSGRPVPTPWSGAGRQGAAPPGPAAALPVSYTHARTHARAVRF